MTTQSWKYDTQVPKQTVPLATHSTYYGSSSLASSSNNALVIDKYAPNGLYTIFDTVRGVPGSHTTIYDDGKPTLGVLQAREAWDERFMRKNAMAETVPNVNVLKSKYTLNSMDSRPTALM